MFRDAILWGVPFRQFVATDAALRALQRQWSVVPVHAVVGGRCTCGDPGCASPGKHPRVRWDEYGHRLPTEDEVRRWWRRWPEANLGIVTGAVSGLLVVDVDPRAGGDEELAHLEERFGALPDTVECLTGGGGLHLYFRHPGGVVRSGPLAPGVEVKADGGLVVAPPSVHRSGASYVWETGGSPEERELADAPAWLADPSEPGEAMRVSRRVFAPRTPEERSEFAQLWDVLGVRILPGDRYYLCPLHDDHRPSLHVDAEGCRWYCFGCRRGGGPGRLRRIVARRGQPSQPAAAVRAVASRSAARAAVVSAVPSTWMQWPTLQPGSAQAVVGEANYADALEHLAAGRTWGGLRTRWFTAHLRREHTNPNDPGAVRVEIGGATVGYLPRDDAPRFHVILHELASEHVPATARARLTGGWERGPYGRGSIGVVLDVDPRVLRRRADTPFLPVVREVAVVVDPSAREALSRLLDDAPSADVTATLLVPRDDGPQAVRVSVVGEEIGTLTAATTAKYLALVRRVVAAGLVATCAATIERGRRGLRVRVWLPRPDEP